MYNQLRFHYFIGISIIIIIIIIIIIYLIIFNSNIESIRNNNTLICIGDSILNNENYVPKGKSVINYLQNDINVINMAQDNAKISDVYTQLRKIPSIKSDMNMNIVLSVGGNNLLEYEPIEFVYIQYVDLVSYILATYDCKLYILNLYYPIDESMKKYYEIITKWNSMLNQIPIKYNIDVNIINISKIITKPTDLVNKIEPSVVGGLQIANKIIKTVK